MFLFWKSLNNFGKAIFLILFSILVIFLSEVRADFLLRNAIDTVSVPIAQLFHGVSRRVLEVGTFVGSIGSLNRENKLLERRVEILESQEARVEELTLENHQLRSQLSLKQKEGYTMLDARVVAREPAGVVRVVTIDRGEQDGITEKMPVVVSDGLLVGYVRDVYSKSARVSLILDPTVEVPSKLQQSRADGIVKGQELGQGLIMDLIPQGVEVARNNLVVTSGIGDIFPSGLLVGYVQAVYREPNAIFQKADILPAVDFDRLELVTVITGY